jgi:oligopeptide transport system ATP-binding protein
MTEKVLNVDNLSISFRTPNGLVRAVRNISFNLYKGETLAIVGESGSGKSVTNRAIMGILAGNGIIDNGSIMYKGQDLAKLSEANFHAIRGNKIGMIFQDPLSSLNPTMKIGKQITEAMIVNGNRIKNKMVDMYHDEFYAYVNKVKEIQILKQALKNKIFEVQLEEQLNKKEKNFKFKK